MAIPKPKPSAIGSVPVPRRSEGPKLGLDDGMLLGIVEGVVEGSLLGIAEGVGEGGNSLRSPVRVRSVFADLLLLLLLGIFVFVGCPDDLPDFPLGLGVGAVIDGFKLG